MYILQIKLPAIARNITGLSEKTLNRPILVNYSINYVNHLFKRRLEYNQRDYSLHRYYKTTTSTDKEFC